ncbi:MAG: indole-3-glycerol phosphate synthase TrpC [Chloroflexota bacterium]|nr:MAG: indole-3-glycerol phosphate synthase TrpC [Chloroflexota bacterium]
MRTDSVLDAIVARKRIDLDATLDRQPLAVVRRQAEAAGPGRGFGRYLRGDTVSVIAEIKRASPSKGILAADIDPVAIGQTYERSGAAAISVLTEEHQFLGSLADLAAVRASVALPLLRKDFLFDPYHLYEARVAGADAVLLIVAMLEQSTLIDLIALADEVGLDALIEVHRDGELDRAMAVNARIIGINNRDLHTFAVDLAVTERLAPRIPRDRVIVGESGVFGPADVTRLRAVGVDALLVGESFMRAGVDGVGGLLAAFRRVPSA